MYFVLRWKYDIIHLFQMQRMQRKQRRNVTNVKQLLAKLAMGNIPSFVVLVEMIALKPERLTLTKTQVS